MGKEGTWSDKNVDLKKLGEKIKQFFYDDGFSEVVMYDDPNGGWYEIQARKTGAFRTVVSSRKAIHTIIKGNPNKFNISVGTGEWVKTLSDDRLQGFKQLCEMEKEKRFEKFKTG